MYILIEISDEEYKKISNSNPSYADDFSIYYAIKNGTPINAEDVEAFNMAIEALEQEPRWIPVTKRQPKKSGKYWCTFGGTNLTGSDYYTTESDAKEIFDDAAEEYTGWQSQNVIAWMPLPESYRAESEGK